MKRIAIILGLVLIVLASCTKDIVKEVNNGLAIDFRVSTQTRATEVTNSTLSSFHVTAISGDDVYFSEIEFKAQGTPGAENNYFISDDKYYWPESGDLDFYAYYPSAADLGGTLSISGTGKTLTGFSPKSEIAAQVDFIVAKARGNKASNQQDGVALSFQHMLSQIEINAKNSNSEYDITVGGFALKGVKSKGDFSFEDLTWSLEETLSDYSVDYTSTSGIALGPSSVNIMGQGTGTAMLLPQDLSTEGMSATLEVQVNITRKSDDEGASGLQVFPETGTFGTMSVPITTKWESGYKYAYTLDLTGSLGQPIQFTMEVVPWNEEKLEVPGRIDIVGKWRMDRIEITKTYKDGRTSETIAYTQPSDILNNLPAELYIVDVISDNKYVNLNNEELDFKIYENQLCVQFEQGGQKYPFDLISLSEDCISYKEVGNIIESDEVVGTKEVIYTYKREIPKDYDLTGTWQITKVRIPNATGEMTDKVISGHDDLANIAIKDIFRIAIIGDKYYFNPGVLKSESEYYQKESTYRIEEDRLYVNFPESGVQEFIIETINSTEAIFSNLDGNAIFYYTKQTEEVDLVVNIEGSWEMYCVRDYELDGTVTKEWTGDEIFNGKEGESPRMGYEYRYIKVEEEYFYIYPGTEQQEQLAYEILRNEDRGGYQLKVNFEEDNSMIYDIEGTAEETVTYVFTGESYIAKFDFTRIDTVNNNNI